MQFEFLKITSSASHCVRRCSHCSVARYVTILLSVVFIHILHKKVQVGNDQEKAQSERNSHSKKTKWEEN